MRGKFIVFEGIDGCGKSTQVARLAERLQKAGHQVALTAEPTDLPSGRILRQALSGKLPKSECEMAVLFVTDRIAHNISEGGIRSLLDRGVTVICDRYYYSTLAYQGLTTDYAWVKSMNLDCPEITRPDLCIYLDLLPEESLRRIAAGRDNVEIYENHETLTEVRNRFLEVIGDLRAAGERIETVDASGSREEIADRIFEAVCAIF